MDAGLLTFKAAAGVDGSKQSQAPAAATAGVTTAAGSLLSLLDIKSAKQAVTKVGAAIVQPRLNLGEWFRSMEFCGQIGHKAHTSLVQLVEQAAVLQHTLQLAM